MGKTVKRSSGLVITMITPKDMERKVNEIKKDQSILQKHKNTLAEMDKKHSDSLVRKRWSWSDDNDVEVITRKYQEKQVTGWSSIIKEEQEKIRGNLGYYRIYLQPKNLKSKKLLLKTKDKKKAILFAMEQAILKGWGTQINISDYAYWPRVLKDRKFSWPGNPSEGEGSLTVTFEKMYKELNGTVGEKRSGPFGSLPIQITK